jgi:HEAT repeat protein
VAPVEPCVAVLAGPDAVGRGHVAKLIGTLADKLDAAARARFGQALRDAITLANTRWNDDRTRSDEEHAWREALWAAARVGDAGALDLARATVKAADARSPGAVRREALRVVARLGGAQDQPLVVAALSDTDASVRRAAIDALADKDVAQAARAALAVEPFDPVTLARVTVDASVRAALMKDARGRKVALASVIARAEVDELVSLATLASEPDVRIEACLALGRAGGARAKEALATVAKDKKGASAELRKKAYAALKRAVRAEKRAQKFSTRKVSTIRAESEASR